MSPGDKSCFFVESLPFSFKYHVVVHSLVTDGRFGTVGQYLEGGTYMYQAVNPLATELPSGSRKAKVCAASRTTVWSLNFVAISMPLWSTISANRRYWLPSGSHWAYIESAIRLAAWLLSSKSTVWDRVSRAGLSWDRSVGFPLASRLRRVTRPLKRASPRGIKGVVSKGVVSKSRYQRVSASIWLSTTGVTSRSSGQSQCCQHPPHNGYVQGWIRAVGMDPTAGPRYRPRIFLSSGNLAGLLLGIVNRR